MTERTLTIVGWILGGLFWGAVLVVVALDILEWFA